MESIYWQKDNNGNRVGRAVLSKAYDPRTYCDYYSLSDIRVYSERGRGWGTKLLKAICEQADREQVDLRLVVAPIEPGYYRRLVRWYERHGFIKSKRSRMIRKPKWQNLLPPFD